MKKSILSLVAIASLAHAANRAYCASLGDTSQLSWADAPDWQKQSAMAGVKMHQANPDATPEDSHKSWLAQKLADGWTYGPVKDEAKKAHPCCVPYDELPQAQKAKDYIFRGMVHALSALSLEDLTASARTVVKTEPEGVAITYIGARDSFMDRAYGSRLTFTPGKTRTVPADLARRLLRHKDLFEPAKDAPEDKPADALVDDDTAAILQESANSQALALKEQNRVQELRERVQSMDKDALDQFALTNYRQNIDKRLGVAKLREQVIGFIDQFGAL